MQPVLIQCACLALLDLHCPFATGCAARVFPLWFNTLFEKMEVCAWCQCGWLLDVVIQTAARPITELNNLITGIILNDGLRRYKRGMDIASIMQWSDWPVQDPFKEQIDAAVNCHSGCLHFSRLEASSLCQEPYSRLPLKCLTTKNLLLCRRCILIWVCCPSPLAAFPRPTVQHHTTMSTCAPKGVSRQPVHSRPLLWARRCCFLLSCLPQPF